MDINVEKNDFQSLFCSIAEKSKKIGIIKEVRQPNIFKILGIEAKEVLLCRFLGYLLKLDRKDDEKSRPINSFIVDVLGGDFQEQDKASADLEFVIDDRRRVDIVIKNEKGTGETIVYPIEVKIEADDQEAQLYDYYSYFFHDSQDNSIYYLTPTERKPSTDSTKSKDKKQIIPGKCINITFANQIAKWLDTVVVSDDLKLLVHQFKEVIVEMRNEKDIEDAILGAVELKTCFQNLKNELKDTEELRKLKSLIVLLQANGDRNGAIQRRIQKEYLKEFLIFDKSIYECSEPDGTDQKGVDRHAVLYIWKKGPEQKQRIASICIDTNLYLRCEVNNVDVKKLWNNESWTYIQPNGHDKNYKYQLNDCSNIIDDPGEIDISGPLKKIEKALG